MAMTDQELLDIISESSRLSSAPGVFDRGDGFGRDNNDDQMVNTESAYKSEIDILVGSYPTAEVNVTLQDQGNKDGVDDIFFCRQHDTEYDLAAKQVVGVPTKRTFESETVQDDHYGPKLAFPKKVSSLKRKIISSIFLCGNPRISQPTLCYFS